MEMDPLHSKLDKILTQSDIVVIAKCIAYDYTSIDKLVNINFYQNAFQGKARYIDQYSLQVSSILAFNETAQKITRIDFEDGHTTTIQVLQPIGDLDNNASMYEGSTYLLFLKKLDTVKKTITSKDNDDAIYMQVVDGKRSIFEYGQASEYQRHIQRESFHTESMQELTEATAALCDLMKKGTDTKSLLEKLNADKRYIFKYAAEQYQKIPKEKRARFVYTNSKLSVLPPNGPVRGVHLLPKKAQ